MLNQTNVEVHAPPEASPRLLEAAQFAYDTRLSQKYENTTIKWDLEYTQDGIPPIPRPNHGLAHSARGAMYAPTVINYFRDLAPDKENYQFSPADVEKIQIALMFRVTGRENEAGYNDDKKAYAEYQKNHAVNFRKYCDAHPGIFSKQEEELYANTLETYANPESNTPLAIIFKTCHNLDLLRVRDPKGMEKELAVPVAILGQENVNDLMKYADSCIRATGNRICAPNPIVGKGTKQYDPDVFPGASTNVQTCMGLIQGVPVPTPKPKAQSVEVASAIIAPNTSPSIPGPAAETEKPIVDVSGLAKKVDRSETPAKQITSSERKVLELYGTLDSDLKLPSPLKIILNGKVLEGKKAHLALRRIMNAIIRDIVISKNSPNLLDLDKPRIELLLSKMMIIQQALKKDAIENQFGQYDTWLANTTLSIMQKKLERQGAKPFTEGELHAESAKRHFIEGKGEGFREHLKQASASQTPEGEKPSGIALEMGPLNKNSYTSQYEALAKGMLAGKEFTVITRLDSKQNTQVYVEMDGTTYNLTKIMKYANLNHLSFDKEDCNRYVDMLCSDKVINGPQKPDPAGSKIPRGVKGREDIMALDRSFVERDPRLQDMDPAERLALNIYTSSTFYTDINAMLRGNIKTEKLSQEGWLRELICTAGMGVYGLNHVPGEKPIDTFRGEDTKKLPPQVLAARIAAAEAGGITMESGFISSALDKPATEFAFGQEYHDTNIGIAYHNLIGKDISGLTAFPHEREFLIPPTQIQWEHHVTAKGGHLFSARPVTSLTGLSEKAMMADPRNLPTLTDQVPENVELKVEAAVESQVAPSIESPPVAAATEPLPVAAAAEPTPVATVTEPPPVAAAAERTPVAAVTEPPPVATVAETKTRNINKAVIEFAKSEEKLSSTIYTGIFKPKAVRSMQAVINLAMVRSALDPERRKQLTHLRDMLKLMPELDQASKELSSKINALNGDPKNIDKGFHEALLKYAALLKQYNSLYLKSQGVIHDQSSPLVTALNKICNANADSTKKGLGFQGAIIEPVQRGPRFNLLLNEIAKQDDPNDKVTQRRLQRLSEDVSLIVKGKQTLEQVIDNFDKPEPSVPEPKPQANTSTSASPPTDTPLSSPAPQGGTIAFADLDEDLLKEIDAFVEKPIEAQLPDRSAPQISPEELAGDFIKMVEGETPATLQTTPPSPAQTQSAAPKTESKTTTSLAKQQQKEAPPPPPSIPQPLNLGQASSYSTHHKIEVQAQIQARNSNPLVIGFGTSLGKRPRLHELAREPKPVENAKVEACIQQLLADMGMKNYADLKECIKNPVLMKGRKLPSYANMDPTNDADKIIDQKIKFAGIVDYIVKDLQGKLDHNKENQNNTIKITDANIEDFYKQVKHLLKAGQENPLTAAVPGLEKRVIEKENAQRTDESQQRKKVTIAP